MAINKFYIIGAQKAGTTALWRYLSLHPEISMPTDKESPFFLSKGLISAGWDTHVSNSFQTKPNTTIEGSASPYYMCYPIAAKRIARQFPDAKFIIILRDPIERAYSHYSMLRRIGNENRSFEQAVSEQLGDKPSRLLQTSFVDNLTESDDMQNYLVYGNYRFIFEYYNRFFKKESFLFIDFNDFNENPDTNLYRILSFLEVDNSFKPHNLGQRYNVGGDSFFISLLKFVRKCPKLIYLLKKALPLPVMRFLRIRLATLNGRKNPNTTPPLSKEIHDLLHKYYENDAIFMEENLK